MKPVKVLLYALLLAAVGAYLYFFEIRKKQEDTAQKGKKNRILNLAKDKISEIVIKDANGAIVARKPGDVWVLTEPIKTKADEPAVQGLLSYAAGAKYDRVILERDVDWKEYGLAPAELVVEFATPDKRSTIAFGAKNPARTADYLRVNEDHELLMAPDVVRTTLAKTVFNLRDKAILSTAPGDVDSLKVTDFRGEMEIKRIAPGKFEMVKPEKMRVKGPIMGSNLQALTSLSAKEIIDQPSADGDTYGFASPYRSFTLTGPKRNQTLEIGAQKQDTKVGDRYAQVVGTDEVFVIPESALKRLRFATQDLRDTSTLEFEPSEIERIRITLDGVTRFFALDTKNNKWRMEEPHAKGRIEQWPISSLLWDIKDLQWRKLISPIPADLSSVFLARPELSVELFKKGEVAPLLLKAGWKVDGNGDAGKEEKKTELPEPELVYVSTQPSPEGAVVYEVSGAFVVKLRDSLSQFSDTK